MAMSLRQGSCWAVLLFVFCGCGTANLRLSYRPSGAPTPIQAAKLPRVYLDRMEDKTPLLFPNPAGPQDLRFEPPMDTVLRDALRTELGRLGIPVAATRGEADALLRAALTMNEFMVDTTRRRGSSLSVLFSLLTPAGRTVWEDTIVGSGQLNATFLTPGVLQKAARIALAAVMAQVGPAFEDQAVLAKVFAAGAAPGVARPAPGRPAKDGGAAAAARSDIDELPAAAPPKDKAHAVVIGIRRYQQGLPEAEFADADVGLVRTYLTKVLGYQEANVAALVGEGATKSAFEKYFESWLPNRVEPGGEVFVYFAGHGAPNPKTGDANMLPYDGDPTYLTQTGYPLKRLYAELAKLPAGKVTVVLDSCFSGVGGRSVIAKGARPLVTVAAGTGIPDKVTVLSAAAGDQSTYPFPEKGHGLFTYFFLKGLKERAGHESVDMNAVFDYAAPQVANMARREFNAEQTPQRLGKP